MDTEYQRHTNINIYLRALDTQAHISFSAYFLHHLHFDMVEI